MKVRSSLNNKRGKIDLQTHSYFSDGTDPPRSIVKRAEALGLKVIALTDHDTVDGNEEFLKFAKGMNVLTIPGIEFTVADEEELRDIDVLGYFTDLEKYFNGVQGLRKICQKIKDARIERTKQIINILNKEKIKINLSEVVHEAGKEAACGKKHIAKVIMRKNRGQFRNMQEVFDRYLGAGMKADVPLPFAITMCESVQIIHSFGGKAVLAHPGVSNGKPPNKNNGIRLMKKAFKYGFDGAEGYYLYHKNRPYSSPFQINKTQNKRLCEFYINFIQSQNKIITAGSDYHGKNKNIELGEACGEYSLYLNLML